MGLVQDQSGLGNQRLPRQLRTPEGWGLFQSLWNAKGEGTSKKKVSKEKWGSLKLKGISVKVKDKRLRICKEKVVDWTSRQVWDVFQKRVWLGKEENIHRAWSGATLSLACRLSLQPSP